MLKLQACLFKLTGKGGGGIYGKTTEETNYKESVLLSSCLARYHSTFCNSLVACLCKLDGTERQRETTFHYWWRVKSSLNWFGWNLPPHATHWLATRWSSASAHNIFFQNWFWPSSKVSIVFRKKGGGEAKKLTAKMVWASSNAFLYTSQ
jgi:hypothetical protein